MSTATACGIGIAIQGTMPPMLRIALAGLKREGTTFVELPECNGDVCGWTRGVAECMHRGACSRAVVFCEDACVACCVTNKVPGIRAASVYTVPQAERALRELGANVLIVETAGRTYFEFRQILRLGSSEPANCPPNVAGVLETLDRRLRLSEASHAHR